MKKSLFIVVCFILCSVFVTAQNQLLFTTLDSSKSVLVNKNDLVKLSYKGYMNQPQEAEGKVTELNDSTITLTPRKKLFGKNRPAQTIMVNHITGFRRYSNFRAPGEIIYSFVSIGITGTITAIISSASVPAALSFLSAAGTQTVTTAMRNVFFSSKIKNHLQNGWHMKVRTALVPVR